jgi:hypothetical protein
MEEGRKVVKGGLSARQRRAVKLIFGDDAPNTWPSNVGKVELDPATRQVVETIFAGAGHAKTNDTVQVRRGPDGLPRITMTQDQLERLPGMIAAEQEKLQRQKVTSGAVHFFPMATARAARPNEEVVVWEDPSSKRQREQAIGVGEFWSHAALSSPWAEENLNREAAATHYRDRSNGRYFRRVP